MTHHFKKKITNSVVLYGHHAVFAALKNQRRKILKLICTPDNEQEIKQFFPSVNFNIAQKKEIEKIVPQNAVHQGIVAIAQPLENLTIEDVCALGQTKDKCRVLILDQITDPQNIGAIMRSAAAFNVDAIIVQDKNAPSESGAMAKASAGTIEIMPVARTTNLSRAIETLKKSGFWIVGMDAHATQRLDEINKNTKLAIIMGSEGFGMRRLVQESCDITVRLNMNPNIESLNVSAAAAIVLYEINK